jgi:predicted small secreted protein
MLKTLSMLSLLSLTALAACNTVSGAGKDLERGGQAIEETANDVQQSIY